MSAGSNQKSNKLFTTTADVRSTEEGNQLEVRVSGMTSTTSVKDVTSTNKVKDNPVDNPVTSRETLSSNVTKDKTTDKQRDKDSSVTASHNPTSKDISGAYLPPKVGADLDVPDDPFGDEYTDRRLWFGNLDLRLTEFAMLKIIQKYSDIRKMDFVYHRGGPDKGKSKGYCFISFHTWEAADNVRRALDGKLVMRRPMIVKWAQGMRELRDEEASTASGPTVSSMPLASGGRPSTNRSITAASDAVSADAKIKAIEAKLQMMQSTSLDIGEAIKPPPGWTPLTRSDERSRPYRKSHSHHRHPRR